MFRRFLLHKAIGDKGLLLILPKPSIYPRLLLGTFVGNVNNIRTTIRVICTASLHGSQVEVYELRRKGVRRGSRARVGLVGCQPDFPNLLVCRSPRRDSACHSVRPRLWIRAGRGRWLRVGEKSWRGASMRRRVRILISTRTTWSKLPRARRVR